MALTALAGLPLFQFRPISGHDAFAYLPRSVEFWRSLESGWLVPRWAPDLNFGYGEPFFLFNPPLLYYLSALFHLLGASFVAAQSLTALTLLLLSALGMYVLAQSLFGRQAGLVCAAAYLFAPYLLVTLYVRHAWADFAAFAFLPWAVWGLARFARRGAAEHLLVGTFATALIVLSSNPVTLMAVPMLALVVLAVALERSRGWALIRGASGLVLGLGLAAYFWIPALAERHDIKLGGVLHGYFEYGNHFVYPIQFLDLGWGYGLSRPDLQDDMSFAIGPLHLLLALVTAAWGWRRRRSPGAARAIVAACLVVLIASLFLASTASWWVWDRLPMLHYLQYPWRFLSLVAFTTALLSGVPFLLISAGRGWMAPALMLALLGVVLALGYSHARPQHFRALSDEDVSPSRIAANNIRVTNTGEYQPRWVIQQPEAVAPGPATVLEGPATLVVKGLAPGLVQLQAAGKERSRIRLNTSYFPGWRIYVDGVQHPYDVDSPLGTMSFTLEAGAHNLEARFEDTPIRLWARAMTLVSLLALVAVALSVWHLDSGGIALTREPLPHRVS